MRSLSRPSSSSLAAGAAFVVALSVAVELLRPLRAGSVGFDTSASVIHFERLVAGRHLESFVTATPKPLLTLVDGSLMALVADWRVVAWATILAFAAAIAAGTALAGRLAGLGGGVFAGFLVMSSARLLDDVAIGYALAWATLLCFAAGLAVVAARPRPALAGIALAGATLARLEVVAIVGAALAVLVAAQLVARSRGPSGPSRSWWGIALALLAFPIMALHDLLLTGDPLFWMTVSQVFSRQAPDAVLSPGGVVALIVRRMAAEWPLVVLAAVGAVALWRSRQWAGLVGVAGSTIGVASFLVAIAVRGTYVSERYLGLIDLGVRFAAGIGLAAIAAAVANLVAARRPALDARLPIAAGIVATALVGLVATWRPGFIDASVRRTALTTQRESRHADAALPILRCAIASIPGGVPLPPPSTTLAIGQPTDSILLGPVLMRPRLAHDLALPLGSVAGVTAAQLDPRTFLPRGLIVFHDRLSDRPVDAFRILEIHGPTTVGDVTLTPLLADAEEGTWILWVGRPAVLPAPTMCGSGTSALLSPDRAEASSRGSLSPAPGP